MRQTDGYEDNSGGLPLIGMALGVSFFVLLVLLLVVALNKDDRPSSGREQVLPASSQEETEERVQVGEGVAGDLDFWGMYPTQEESAETEEPSEPEEEPATQEDLSADGGYVQVEYRDGTSEWLEINPKWKKNSYDFSNLVSKNGLYSYYSNGKQVSFLGLDISRYQQDINYAAVKNEGVDFCMIRAGARGYATGAIQADEAFETHIQGAVEAGLDVGLYFYSQAMTEAEAVEEADFLLSRIAAYPITYPIAFVMEFVENDTARIETLTKAEKTKAALAFLQRIEEAGYTGMLYGNKEWLLARIDLAQFEDYDIWLAEEADIPDYPYAYSMWQYTRQGEIYGIDGEVNLNLSFVDYSAR